MRSTLTGTSRARRTGAVRPQYSTVEAFRKRLDVDCALAVPFCCVRVLFLGWVALELATLAEYLDVVSGDRRSIVTDGVMLATGAWSWAVPFSRVDVDGGCSALRFRLGPAAAA